MKYVLTVLLTVGAFFLNIQALNGFDMRPEEPTIKIVSSHLVNENEALVPLNVAIIGNRTHQITYHYVIESDDEFEVFFVSCLDCLEMNYLIEEIEINTYFVEVNYYIPDCSCVPSSSSISVNISFKLKKVNLE